MKKNYHKGNWIFLVTPTPLTAMDIYQNLYPDDIPHALRGKRTPVVAQLKQLQAETDPVVKMFEDTETTRQI